MPPNQTPETSSEEVGNPPSEFSMETSVAGRLFSKPLLNSSNPSATTLEDLTAFAKSEATGGFSSRTACPGFVHDDAIHQWRPWSTSVNTSATNSINCYGYSPEPFEFYISTIQKVQSTVADKPAVISISGSAEQVRDMLKKAGEEFQGNSKNKILIEMNLSCPNFCGKPPIAYDFEGMREYLSIVFSEGSHGLSVGCKTTPYFYPEQFQGAAAVINAFPEVRFVTCINTVGSGLVIDTDTESAVLPATYGGLGGPAVHATALANVHQMRKLLRDDIDIIGVGGVDSGAAAFSMLLCGASAVAVGTAVLHHGVGVFDKIGSELEDIMVKKGYSSITDFQGKLKTT